MKKLSILLHIAILMSAMKAYSQEGGVTGGCDDGIDNDGDGYVDCYDSQCVGTTDCKDFYIGVDASCEIEPTEFPQFFMREAWRSNGPQFWGSNHTVIGDFSGDGVPELFSMRRNDDEIYVFNGDNGNHVQTINIGRDFGLFMVIGDAEDDNCPELYVAAKYSGNFRLVAFDCNYNLKWTSTEIIGNTNGDAESIGIPGIADFDHDGTPEIYIKNQIFNAQTGAMLAWDNTVNWQQQNAGAVAADFLPNSACADCAGLELLVGDKLYSVNTGDGSAGSGQVTLENQLANYYDRSNLLGNNNNHTTSIADLDLDGDVDALIIGTDAVDDEETVVYYWDVQSNDAFSQKIRDDSWFGAGRINIGDLDGDGYPDFSLNNVDLYAFTIDFAGNKFDKLWERNHSDVSGFTGTSLFDFNGDGRMEMVYRDMDYLYVLDGLTGNLALPAEIPCYSGTYADYPIVGDIDGNGATEICVACNQGPGHVGNDNTARFRIYEAAGGERWMNSRRVWNQHGYFNTNINDDLSVPITQQDHIKVFSSGICTTGDNRPLNSFLNQSPQLDINGCPNFGAPDLTFSGTPTVFPPICGQDTFYVSFDIINDGDAPFSRQLYVSFYDNDPTASGAVKLNTDSVNIDLDPGETMQIDSLHVLGNGASFNLYISLNDPVTVLECVNTNNTLNTPVDTSPFTVRAQKMSDNFKCDPAAADNGNARAFVDIGGNEITAGYTFTWLDASNTPVYTGTNFSGMAEGTYGVTARNDALNCGSDTVSITIDLLNNIPVINITQLQPVSNCQVPNGEAEAFALENGFDVSADYDFTWYEGSTVFVNQFGVGKIATGLAERNYVVYGVNTTNGCSGIRLINVVGDLEYPDVAITNIENIDNCAYPYGQLTGEVTEAGAVRNSSDYTFTWYNGDIIDPLQEIFNENESVIDSLNTGFYTVEVINNSTLCKSIAQIAEIVDNRPSFTVDITLEAAYTSCINPDGILSANVGGNTSDYDFYWYRGNNTTVPLNSIESTSGENNSRAENLSDITYTVKAVHKVNQCEATTSFVVPRDNMNVVASPTLVSHQTNCWPRNGEVTATANGGLSGNYQFYWFHNNPGTNPDTTNANHVGASYAGIRNGDYWVVATDAVYGCFSEAVEIEVDRPASLPDIAFTYTPNATCDPSLPNGSVTADVIGQPESNYNFRWYLGKTTNNSFRLPNSIVPTAQVVGSDNQSLANVPDEIFTVRIRDNTTNCSDTAVAVIPVATPPDVVANLSTSPVTICNPPNGSAQANVGGAVSGYSFNYYIGQNTKPTPDLTGSSQTGLLQGWYTVVAIDNNTHCQSDPVTDSVRYDPGFNIVDIVATDGTTCVAEDGMLEVIHAGGVGPFTYQWFRGNTTNASNFVDNTQIINNVKQGLYTAIVTDQSNNCPDQDTVSLGSADFIDLNTNTNPMTNCGNPNGSVFAEVDGAVDQSIFRFFWFDGNSIILDGSTDGFDEDATGQTRNDLEAGEYTVIAKQTFGDQCESEEVTVTVVADAVPPAVVMSGNPNTHCATPFSGEVTAKAQTANGQPQPVDGYTFDWYQTGLDNFSTNSITSQIQPPVGNDSIAHTISGYNGNLPYSVIVTNRITLCSDTVQYNLANNLLKPQIANNTVQDIDQCGILGSIAITGMSYGSPADFTYSWYYQDTLSSLTPISSTINNLDTGVYIVQAIDNVTRCKTSPLDLRIEDLRAYPTAFLSVLQPQKSIKPGFFTGEIAASAEEEDGSIDIYNFDWFRDDFSNNLISSLNETSDTLYNREQGDYLVIATNANTDCADTAMANIPFAPPTIEIIDVLVQHKTWCAPDNGALEVDSITREGVGADLGGFDYYWYRNSYVEDISQADFVTNSPLLSGLKEGTYFVVARDTLLHIQSLPYQIIIEDQSVIPTIELVSRRPQRSCDNDNTNHNGSLEISVDNGAPVVDYNFDWYAGQDTIGNILPTNSHLIAGLTTAYYTVNVTSQITGCKNFSTYYVPDSIPPINVVLSANPNTNCDNFNGSVFANVLNREQETFDFFWFEGASGGSITNADYLGASVDSLSGGNYTLVVQDTIERSCLTVPETIAVPDILNYPDFLATTAPATNCDPLLPNGKADLQISDSTGSFRIAWFNLPSSDTTAVNDQVKDLAHGDYLVVVQNRANFCISDDTVNVAHMPEQLPDPEISILNHLTNCSQPNGALEGNYIKNLIDYTIYWYDGGQESNTPDHSGNPYIGLDIGAYGLKLRSKITGCETNVVVENIDDKRVYPEYQLEVTNASCEQSNGEVRLVPVVPEWFYQVAWDTPDGMENGLMIREQPSGEYPFLITTDQECTTAGTAEIIDDIIIYNGVSANQDGLNDWFIISCIESYPQNNVKIFNRAGDLVFEMDGYDNSTRYFQGTGNRGLYLGEKDLPIGTYFYVVDLKNNSEIQTGYLELVR